MAQLPLRIPTTHYISNDTTLAVYGNPWPSAENTIKPPPKISSTQSNADHKVIKSILRFLRSLKRKKQGPKPPSSENFKFLACFSNPPPDVHVQEEERIERNTSDSNEDDNGNDFCFSYDFLFEGDNMPTKDSPSVATEEVEATKDIRLNKDMEIATFNSVRSLLASHAHMLSLFVVKIQKAMSHPGSLAPTIFAMGAKRKLQVLRLSLDNKHKSFSKKENRRQIWTRPILMGKRCRKLEDGFPYVDDPSSNSGKIVP